MLGNMWVNVGRERGVGKEASFFGQYLGKSGDFRLRIFPMFFDS